LDSPGVKVRNIFPGVIHAGKYFTLHYLKTGVKRNYGCFFTATEKLLPEYLKLIEAVKEKKDFIPPFDDIYNVYRDGIELFMKTKNGFSKTMDEIPLNSESDKFKLIGPMGCGLRLVPSPKGLIVAAICGTSIAMWLEVVAYMIRKAVYNLGKSMGKNYMLFKNETFDDLSEPNFKLILFSSFNNEGETIGKAVFEVMAFLSKELNLNQFEYHLRLTEKGDPYYSAEYFKERIKGDPERIYFWGPYKVAETLKAIFLSMGYPSTKFYNS